MADPYLGQVKIFAGNFAPRGWALCQGQILPINTNQSLYSLLGTNYGGDGRTSFALPDLRGRSVVGAVGQPGTTSGSESLNLNTAQLPAHTHSIGAVHMRIVADDGPETTPGGNHFSNTDPETYSDVTNAEMPLTVPANTTSAGGTQSINHRQPYLGVNFIIALTGVFPSRN